MKSAWKVFLPASVVLVLVLGFTLYKNKEANEVADSITPNPTVIQVNKAKTSPSTTPVPAVGKTADETVDLISKESTTSTDNTDSLLADKLTDDSSSNDLTSNLTENDFAN